MLDTSDQEKLFEAAAHDDTETIERVFDEKQNATASITDDQGQTLAHVAVQNGNLDMVKYVMLDTSDQKKLFEAAAHNDTETIKSVFDEKENATASITDDRGQTLAHVAVQNGNLDMVKYVLEKEPSLLAKLDNDDYSVLHLAVEKGALDIVKYLVERHNANITARNRHDLARTFVHIAVQGGHLNMLKYFVEERHVDVNEPGEWQDKPPVFLAVQYRHPDIFDYLAEEKKADLTTVDFFGENILFIAAKVGDLPLIKRLLDDKKIEFDLDRRNNNGETLAMTSLMVNQTDVLKYLVDKKRVDVNIPEKWDNTTLLHLAASQNDYKTCKYLIAHGAKIKCRDKFGQIPVQRATDELLIEYMRNMSKIIRSSRSVNFIPYSSFQPITLMNHSVVRDSLRELERGASVGQVYYFPINSLLNVVVEMLKNRFKTPHYFSSSINVSEKIDPIAVEAVIGDLNFEESRN